jgi:dUTP pyrophosphatase
MKVKFKKIHDNISLPTYAHEGDSGMDVYAKENIQLKAMQPTLVPLGFKVEIPKGYEIQVRPKSGLSLKGITVFNTPGTIDSNYRGECGVILFNANREPFDIKMGAKLAQIVLCPVYKIEWEKVTSLDETTRGEGGFGSTGEK